MKDLLEKTARQDVAAIVLRGAGEKAFSAGSDVNPGANATGQPAQGLEGIRHVGGAVAKRIEGHQIDPGVGGRQRVQVKIGAGEKIGGKGQPAQRVRERVPPGGSRGIQAAKGSPRRRAR